MADSVLFKFIFALTVFVTVTVVRPAELVADKLQTKFQENNGLFALDIYRNLFQSAEPKNLILSPLAIQVCMGMVHAGSAGETATEIQNGARLIDHDRKEVAKSFQNILDLYSDGGTVQIANKVYLKSGTEIRDEYLEIVHTNYKSDAENLDFSRNTESATTINDWVKNQTHGGIRNVIDSSSLDEYTEIVFINAIHFKAYWLNQFPKSKTFKESFWIAANKSNNVQMMNTNAKFLYSYLPDMNAQILKMAYKDEKFAMVIVLPESRTGLNDLEKKLEGSKLSELKVAMKLTQVNVKIPKFSIKFKVDLTEELKKLGIRSVFDEKSADLSGMLKSKSIFLSQLIHKAVINVDEGGTEVAAITTGSMRSRRSVPEQFIADRPFMFWVEDDQANVLFIGKYGADKSHHKHHHHRKHHHANK